MHIHCCPRRHDMHDTPVGYTGTTQTWSRQRTALASSTTAECSPIRSLPVPTNAAIYCSQPPSCTVFRRPVSAPSECVFVVSLRRQRAVTCNRSILLSGVSLQNQCSTRDGLCYQLRLKILSFKEKAESPRRRMAHGFGFSQITPTVTERTILLHDFGEFDHIWSYHQGTKVDLS
jgi:hypothetical protein